MGAFAYAAALIGVLCVSGAAPTAAQPVRDPVDEGFADVGPLSSSLRRVEPGLRQAEGFERVFRMPGAEQGFYRRQGGTTAVFDRSDYVATPSGTVPIVPPGTVFHIGPVPGIDFALEPEAPRRRSPNLLSARVSLAALPDPSGARRTNAAHPLHAIVEPGEDAASREPAPMIVGAFPSRRPWGGEAVRGERIAAHLDAAFAGAGAASSAGDRTSAPEGGGSSGRVAPAPGDDEGSPGE